MKVELKIDRGPMKGKVFSFNQHDTFLFGRGPTATCQLPEDNYISRNHFLLEVNPPRVFLRDLGSLNGTIVNGKKIGGRQQDHEKIARADQFSLFIRKNQWDRSNYEVELKNSDEIEAGDTVMKVTLVADVKCSRCGKTIDSSEKDKYLQGSEYICKLCQVKEKQARARALQPTIAKAPPAAAQPQPSPVKAGIKPMPRRDPQAEKRAADLIMKLLQNVARSGKPQSFPAFPGYEVTRKLGEGGMGAVYLARGKKKGNMVAIKIIRPDHQASDVEIRRFREREMIISKKMRHKNIVSCLEGDFADGVYYMVMEYVQGSDAQKLIDQKGRVEVNTACRIIVDALHGLEYIHKHKVVHRDLKPPNILLAGSSPNWAAKIADFGLSKNLKSSSSITRKGELAGSVPFMPPDQLLNFKGVGFPADIYSMGATLYTMLTGAFTREYPPNQDPLLVIIQGENIPIQKRLPHISPQLAEVVNRSIAQAPQHRFQSAGEFRKALMKATS